MFKRFKSISLSFQCLSIIIVCSYFAHIFEEEHKGGYCLLRKNARVNSRVGGQPLISIFQQRRPKQLEEWGGGSKTKSWVTQISTSHIEQVKSPHKWMTDGAVTWCNLHTHKLEHPRTKHNYWHLPRHSWRIMNKSKTKLERLISFWEHNFVHTRKWNH